jgi:hypothetical protein
MPCNKAAISSELTTALGHTLAEVSGFENMVHPVINLVNIGKGCMHHQAPDSMLIQLKIDHH